MGVLRSPLKKVFLFSRCTPIIPANDVPALFLSFSSTSKSYVVTQGETNNRHFIILSRSIHQLSRIPRKKGNLQIYQPQPETSACFCVREAAQFREDLREKNKQIKNIEDAFAVQKATTHFGAFVLLRGSQRTKTSNVIAEL